MNAIDILNRCRNAQNELRRLEERINRYRACATDTSAHINPNGRVQGSVSDSLSEFAAEISDCTADYDKRQREYKAESYCACKLLDRLPEVECSVLYRFYLGRQTLHGIAVALNLTDSYVKSKKADGLKLVSQISNADVAALLPDWYDV